MVGAWDRLFALAHPGVRFALDLRGTKLGPPALASGQARVAPMGAAFTPAQLRAYRQRVDEDPLGIRVAHGSPGAAAKSGPLVVFVNAANPLRHATLAQLRRMFTAASAPRGLKWGEVGMSGVWKQRPVRAYGMAATTPIGLGFLADLGAPDLAPAVRTSAQSADVVRQVAEDPNAIGFGRANVINAGVRILALGAAPGGPFALPSPASLEAGSYPLDWYLYLYLRRERGQSLDPLAVAYVRTALSPEGQRAVAATPQGYLPLSPAEIAAELRKLPAAPDGG
jgi:phosphate transport system substrate-binding protein